MSLFKTYLFSTIADNESLMNEAFLFIEYGVDYNNKAVLLTKLIISSSDWEMFINWFWNFFHLFYKYDFFY